MSSPDEEETEFQKLGKKLQQMMAAMPGGQDSPLLQILKSFISFLFGIDDDADAPDFEDAQNDHERASAERDYAGRRASEEKQYGSFRDSARKWTASSVLQTSQQMVALREKAEADNGGRHVRAIKPVREGEYRESSDFGMRMHPTLHTEKMHTGMDFARADKNAPSPDILATMPGVVVGVGVRGGYGNMIEIMDIYGTKHRYAHLAGSSVNVGDSVNQGQKIGVMGSTGRSTGIHLHYEQRDGNNIARAPEFGGKAPVQLAQSKVHEHDEHEVKAALKPIVLPEKVKLAAKAAAKPVAEQQHKPAETYGNGKFEVADIKDGAVAAKNWVFAKAHTAIGGILG